MTADTGDATARQARIAEARRLRAEDGFSKSQIAARLGVSTGLLSTWLQGVDPPAWTKRPNAKDDLRERARELRRQHRSVPEIASELGIAKSTVSRWVRDIPLDVEARKVAFADELASNASRAREASADRWSIYRAQRDAARRGAVAAASASSGSLSKEDIIRIGALVYWCEGTKAKPWNSQRRVTFTNSDSGLILVFLTFLRVVGVEESRIGFRVSIHESADAEAAAAWWATLVGADVNTFQLTTLKRHNPKTVRHNTGSDYHGCLIITVRRGRELYDMIEGCVAGVVRAVDSAPGLGDPGSGEYGPPMR
jgi:transcriptional regulator with XRE-family HTH domain